MIDYKELQDDALAFYSHLSGVVDDVVVKYFICCNEPSQSLSY